jgi:hypothetical protein
VIAKGAVRLDVVYDDGLSMLSYLVADGGFDLKLAAFCQTEVYVAANRTAHPLLGRHAGDGDEAHAGHPAYHIQDFGTAPICWTAVTSALMSIVNSNSSQQIRFLGL